jgi:hypothetical protein
VRRNWSLSCLLVAWLFANGAVWDVVQVVAWARMFHSYVQTDSAAAALARTFDGAQPCELCRISQKARDTEREQLPRDAALGGGMEKLLMIADSAPALVVPPVAVDWPGVTPDVGLTRTDAVPVPPPRV